MRWSVRLRATLVATLTVALALGVAAAVLVGILKSSMEASAGRAAARRAQAAADTLAITGVSRTHRARDLDVPGIGSADLDIRIDDHSLPNSDPAWSEGYATVERTVTTPDGPVTVQGRASLEPARDALNALRNLLLVGIPALLLLVAAVSWVLVGRALAPVSAIRRIFADITTSDLHRRVPVPATGDEVARLARTMNTTLDRLEGAVEQHKRFVADAAHELRSPIATLRTRLELGGREAPELTREALTDVERHTSARRGGRSAGCAAARCRIGRPQQRIVQRRARCPLDSVRSLRAVLVRHLSEPSTQVTGLPSCGVHGQNLAPRGGRQVTMPANGRAVDRRSQPGLGPHRSRRERQHLIRVSMDQETRIAQHFLG